MKDLRINYDLYTSGTPEGRDYAAQCIASLFEATETDNEFDLTSFLSENLREVLPLDDIDGSCFEFRWVTFRFGHDTLITFHSDFEDGVTVAPDVELQADHFPEDADGWLSFNFDFTAGLFYYNDLIVCAQESVRDDVINTFFDFGVMRHKGLLP